MSTPQPLGFLDLPPELRLTVYEHLPISTVSVVQNLRRKNSLLFTAPKFQVALLATCKIIHEEAAPVLHKAMMETLPRVTFSIYVDMEVSLLTRIVFTMAKLRFGEDHFRLYTGATTNRLALVMLWRDALRVHFVMEQYKLDRLCDFCADATQHLRKTGRDLNFHIRFQDVPDTYKLMLRHYFKTPEMFPGTYVVILDEDSNLSGEELVGGNGA